MMIQYELRNESFIGAVHKWHDPHIGERGICQRWHYTINQIGDKEKGGVQKSLKMGDIPNLWMATYKTCVVDTNKKV